MKSAFKIFILFYYSLGTLFLPLGDFSTLQDIPKMYQSCKEHEHHHMIPIDFITDYLINIDGLFDIYYNDYQQKPHKDFHFTHRHSITIYFQEFRNFEFKKPNFFVKNATTNSNYKKLIYIFNINHFIFRPPIVA